MALQSIVSTVVESPGYVAFSVVCAWLVYQLGQAAWNLSPYHPLSRFPGPKLARASYLLEFYYDLILVGQYTKRIVEMHEVYGPLVRINPNEIHCSDPSFINEIYAVGGRKRDKPIHQVQASGTVTNAFFSTTDHDTHRLRRSALSRFFSRAQITTLEPKIHRLVQQLCDKLMLEQGNEKPFDITTAYSCFGSDVISDYCFGQSFGFLTQPSWEPNYRGPLYSLLRPMFVFRFFPFLEPFAIAASGLAKHLSTDMNLLITTLTKTVPDQIRRTKADLANGITAKEETVFGSVLTSSLPASEKSIQRLTDEAASLLGAGTETVSWSLSVITYHLLTQPALMTRLRDELQTIVSLSEDTKTLPPWTTLEKLPYLTAVVHEGLRLSYGVSIRTARIAPEEDLVYRGQDVNYVIPRGYAVGMSPAITHHNEDIFPDSHAFRPERWLDAEGRRNTELERYLLSFSKGSRACIGMNLAFCELHLVLTALVIRVFPHMQLFETTERDIKYHHDLFAPVPEPGSLGVRALIV
ncbi:cytochrome P450 [Aspergillus ellipticus CBS 707.79]|uniref:Cytochrome P450 monooxygenase otaC n=1 Tax=Aspergillus ellipticus CBS 707.79 TaxID=1448320 RepID=A0A319D6Z1_9EURO|nr:cytochrome P450 [Aspergillus ellipticus CBS 707.79]